MSKIIEDSLYNVARADDELLEENDELIYELACCDKCSDFLPEAELVEYDGTYLCDDCLIEHTFICSDCGKRYWVENAHHVDNNVICETCYDGKYTDCSECGRTIGVDSVFYLDEEGEYDSEPLCSRCYDDKKAQFIIKAYKYKPAPIFYGDKGLFYGVELEIDGGGECNENAKQLLDIANKLFKHVYCKHDGSLLSGFEIVTHPMSLEYHRNSMPWKQVLITAVKLGYSSHYSNTSGLHIHIGRMELGSSKDDQESTIGRIVFFVEKFWDQIMIFSRRTEEQINKWASRYGCKENPKCTLEYAKNANLGRYVSLNLENYETIEFRVFRGTLRFQTFIATLQFTDEICQLAKQLTDEAFETLSWNDFIKGISETKPELIAYLKEKKLYWRAC